ncbi:Catechol 2,3-dioxygenase [Halpernia humi]|uniref:Catechol 2,3-dioxygenase n=1 Tax=Halpernia humi TaxID=493375 RepID=A0A1H5TPN3_9FLAO|nr:VOC family protein [Halpernia humi]SEF63977.1 Catechol 2,3-dioxygenase [Halpernia humi]
MKKVIGIGGIFFKTKNPEILRDWYKKHLGFDTNDYGATFDWKECAESSKNGATQWSPFEESTRYFEPSNKEFMINYIVEDLEKLVKELRKENVIILDDIETYDYGKFIHILDCEENKIELWEPSK